MKTCLPKMRRWALGTLVAAAALVLLAAFPSSSAMAWEDCPFGEVDCTYPGDCSRYIDTNGDGICDLSQPAPSSSESTSEADTPIVAASEDTSSGGGRGRHRGQTLITDAEDTTSLAASATSTTESEDSGGFSLLTHYYVSPIAIVFLVIYALSFFLYKTKRIKIATHRKIWNVLLLVTFLITGIFGLILTIQLDYDLPFQMPVNLLFWHVEAGIVMTLISLFHVGWHFKYYAKMLRTSRSKAREAEAREAAYARRGAQRGQATPAPERAYATEHPQTGWGSR